MVCPRFASPHLADTDVVGILPNVLEVVEHVIKFMEERHPRPKGGVGPSLDVHTNLAVTVLVRLEGGVGIEIRGRSAFQNDHLQVRATASSGPGRPDDLM